MDNDYYQEYVGYMSMVEENMHETRRMLRFGADPDSLVRGIERLRFAKIYLLDMIILLDDWSLVCGEQGEQYRGVGGGDTAHG